jgi:aspartokinase-like uncharacterized kinase
MIVVKVGGSLFDHPRLATALSAWLATLGGSPIALVPGGGRLADVVRDYHRIHSLSATAAHWLAIQTIDLNGALLRTWLDESIAIPTMQEFCQQDEGRDRVSPHSWNVTSDSIAARYAEFHEAEALFLLKSTDRPRDLPWTRCAERGLVDGAFPGIVERAPLNVRWVNFRKWIDASDAHTPGSSE